MNYLLCVYTQVQILTGAIKFMHTRFSLCYLWEEENDDDIHVQNKWSFTKKKNLILPFYAAAVVIGFPYTIRVTCGSESSGL